MDERERACEYGQKCIHDTKTLTMKSSVTEQFISEAYELQCRLDSNSDKQSDG